MTDYAIGSHIRLEDSSHPEISPGFPRLVDPFRQESIDRMFTEEQELPWDLLPGTRCLLHTEHVFDPFPVSSWGFVQIRSTFARMGLHLPPTGIDPGFRGQVVVEVKNENEYAAIRLTTGLLLISVIESFTREPEYKGRYIGQTGIQIPRALDR